MDKTDPNPVPDPSCNIKPVYAIVGKDRFLRLEALGDVLKRITPSTGAPEYTRITGTSAELAEVLDEVRTMSLLGGRRVVVVDDADPFITAHRSALERYCGDPADSGTLILLCSSLPRNTRLYRIVNKGGLVILCEPLKGAGLGSWLRQRSTTVHGKKLDPRAAAMMVQLLGPVPGPLDTELGKLAAFVEPRDTILVADVEVLTGQSREEAVFAVTDAIASGDAAMALNRWQQVLATDRAAPGRALGGLAWSVRRLLEAKHAFEQGVSVRELSRRFYTDPETLQRRLGRVTVGELEDQQHDLLAADLAIKTGASTLEAAVERFIVIHASVGSADRAALRSGIAS